MKKLLCPIDFSEVSLNALEFAVAIGEQEKSDLTLLNIFTRSDFNKILESDPIEEAYEQLLEIAGSKLAAISETILKHSRNKGLRSCEYFLKSGKIVDILSEITDEQRFDLIVMGTTGHSAYERKYLGGKAEKIIGHTNCSVLCIPEHQNFHGIQKIVYATDYQEEDKLAIQQIVAFASVLNADLEVLHISHHNDTIDKAMFEDFKEEILQFVHDANLTFNRVVFRHIAQGLDEYMKEVHADLLVLLKKRTNFLESLFHTSLTHHLDKFTDYPLMILKL
ncbi:MAG: universal stress protein [Cytophagales bacterium]|nr:universal stress protein [Cytophagales bacterium]